MVNIIESAFGGAAGLARIASIASALALLGAPAPSTAHVESLYCAPMGGPHDRIASAGGSWLELTPDQLAFARGVWATMPAAHGRLPLGHSAFLSRGGNEPADSIYFIDDDMICARMFISRGLSERLIDVGAGLIVHGGDAS